MTLFLLLYWLANIGICTPSYFYGAILIYNYPIYNYLFGVTYIYAFLLCARNVSLGDHAIWLSIVGYLAMLAACWHDQVLASPLSYAYDIVNIGSIYLGIVVSRSLSLQKLYELFLPLYYILVAALSLIVAMLLLGVISSAVVGDRQIDPAAFYITALIIILSPYIWLARILKGQYNYVIIDSGLGFSSAMLFSVISGTKSLIILAIASTVVFGVLLVRTRVIRLSSTVIRRALVVALIVTVTGASFIYSKRDLMFSRIDGYYLGEESRVEELLVMFDQFQGKLLPGLGLGVMFYSPVSAPTEGIDGLAVAPHIAIATPLLKGGLPLFLLLVVYPVYKALGSLFSKRRQPLRMAISGSLLLYYLLTMMSGGWAYHYLFAVGLLAGKVLYPDPMVSARNAVYARLSENKRIL